MAIVLAAIIVTGFAPTFYLRGYVPLPPMADQALSTLKLVHGIVATMWMGLFVAQTLLVATARVSTHRRMGVLGAALAVVMVAVGAAITVDALRRGVSVAGVDPRVWWLGNTFPPIVLFAVLVGSALVLRRRRETHKRLMLLAMINLVPPALGRIALFYLDPALVTPFSLSSLLAIVLTPIVYDFATRRRVHARTAHRRRGDRAADTVMVAVASTPAGLVFAEWFR